MGHDISLYEFKKMPRQIAALKRSAFNKTNGDIYNILGYEFANNSCSGDGSCWIIEDVEDEEKNSWIEQSEKTGQKDLIIFIKELIKQLNKYGQVLINFG